MDDSLSENQRLIVSFEQRIAIEMYALNEHDEVALVRQVQHGVNIGSDQEKYIKLSDAIEAFIAENHAEYDILFRGVVLQRSDLDSINIGDVIDQHGTSSWSGNMYKASEFAFRLDIIGENVLFSIPNGGNKAASISRYSMLNEDEWLHSKLQQFKVINKSIVFNVLYQRNYSVIELEEL